MARQTRALVLAALLAGCGSKGSSRSNPTASAGEIARDPIASASASSAPKVARSLVFDRGERDLDMLVGGKLAAKTAIMHAPMPDGGLKETALISTEVKVKDDNPEVRKT